jgi:hypothetical protein
VPSFSGKPHTMISGFLRLDAETVGLPGCFSYLKSVSPETKIHYFFGFMNDNVLFSLPGKTIQQL